MNIEDLFKEDYVVLEYNEFIKLNKQANANGVSSPTFLTTEHLLFLTSLVQNLDGKGFIQLSNETDTVKLILEKKNGEMIRSTFSLSLTENYFNKVSKFIDEVI